MPLLVHTYKSNLENENLRRTNERLLIEVARLQNQLGENNRLLKDVSRPKTQSEVKKDKKVGGRRVLNSHLRYQNLNLNFPPLLSCRFLWFFSIILH